MTFILRKKQNVFAAEDAGEKEKTSVMRQHLNLTLMQEIASNDQSKSSQWSSGVDNFYAGALKTALPQFLVPLVF